MKRKEKLLTCLIHPLLERTKIQTGKRKLKALFSFLSVKRRLLVLVFFFPYSSFPHPLQLSVWPRMYHTTTEPHITAPRLRFGESRGSESGTVAAARAFGRGRFGNRGERLRRKEIDRAVSLPVPIVGSEAARWVVSACAVRLRGWFVSRDCLRGVTARLGCGCLPRLRWVLPSSLFPGARRHRPTTRSFARESS